MDSRFSFLYKMSRKDLIQHTILCRKSIMLHDTRVAELNKEIDKLSKENLELQILLQQVTANRDFLAEDYGAVINELGMIRNLHGYYDEVQAQGEDFF